jgi:UDP-N-acetyl-D-galactosamine dehydrogenase
MGKNEIIIGVIGLGYVGMPLALAFSRHYPVYAYDSSINRIQDLQNGIDITEELLPSEFLDIQNLNLISNPDQLSPCNVYIITVPTPINNNKKPDLGPLMNASALVGSVLKKGDVVIYESTVYPGCTEEDCVPVLQKNSGLAFNEDFYCGYSPERIVPGDKNRTLKDIVKITSGSTAGTADFVDNLYQKIIEAGTYKAPSIKIAEAAKVIENCQRDLNISFFNELALIFDRMGIDTQEVIEAASTKFNFIKLKPGLVGGHCISVDPYYLTSKAEALGYYPEVIHSGRRINDAMPQFIANKVVKLMIQKGHLINGAKVLILGITFKENCPDIRNSKVFDVIKELQEFGCEVTCYDPVANINELSINNNLKMQHKLNGKYNAVIHAVAHDCYKEIDFSSLLTVKGVLFDVKATLDSSLVDGKL